MDDFFAGEKSMFARGMFAFVWDFESSKGVPKVPNGVPRR